MGLRHRLLGQWTNHTAFAWQMCPVFLCRHPKEDNVKFIPVVTEVRQKNSLKKYLCLLQHNLKIHIFSKWKVNRHLIDSCLGLSICLVGNGANSAFKCLSLLAGFLKQEWTLCRRRWFWRNRLSWKRSTGSLVASGKTSRAAWKL